MLVLGKGGYNDLQCNQRTCQLWHGGRYHSDGHLYAISTGNAGQCLELAANKATILWAAVYGKDVEIGVSPFLMYAKELTIISTFVSPYSFPRAMNLLPKFELDALITDIVPLTDIKKAFELHRGGKSIKILVKP